MSPTGDRPPGEQQGRERAMPPFRRMGTSVLGAAAPLGSRAGCPEPATRAGRTCKRRSRQARGRPDGAPAGRAAAPSTQGRRSWSRPRPTPAGRTPPTALVDRRPGPAAYTAHLSGCVRSRARQDRELASQAASRRLMRSSKLGGNWRADLMRGKSISVIAALASPYIATYSA